MTGRLPMRLTLTAALVWVASRDVERTQSAARQRGAIDSAVAIRLAEQEADERFLVRESSGHTQAQRDRAAALAALMKRDGQSVEIAPDSETGEPMLVAHRGQRTRLALKAALADGKVQAYGDRGAGKMEEIASPEWARLQFAHDNQAFVPPLPDDNMASSEKAVRWRDVTVERDGLLKCFPPIDVNSSASARTAIAPPEPRPLGRPPGKGRQALKLAKERKKSGQALPRAQERAWLQVTVGIAKSTAVDVLKKVYGPAKNSTKNSTEQ